MILDSLEQVAHQLGIDRHQVLKIKGNSTQSEQCYVAINYHFIGGNISYL